MLFDTVGGIVADRTSRDGGVSLLLAGERSSLLLVLLLLDRGGIRVDATIGVEGITQIPRGEEERCPARKVAVRGAQGTERSLEGSNTGTGSPPRKEETSKDHMANERDNLGKEKQHHKDQARKHGDHSAGNSPRFKISAALLATGNGGCDQVDERADQYGKQTWEFGLGLQVADHTLHTFLMLCGGVPQIVEGQTKSCPAAEETISGRNKRVLKSTNRNTKTGEQAQHTSGNNVEKRTCLFGHTDDRHDEAHHHAHHTPGDGPCLVGGTAM
mmetsp:Transcript_8631/g.21790  ORF Transcript_8631/g.21790 Transcript_8631/m.21790 type:complete len:272 (-) Transcript_8631:221-1036(-)